MLLLAAVRGGLLSRLLPRPAAPAAVAASAADVLGLRLLEAALEGRAAATVAVTGLLMLLAPVTERLVLPVASAAASWVVRLLCLLAFAPLAGLVAPAAAAGCHLSRRAEASKPEASHHTSGWAARVQEAVPVAGAGARAGVVSANSLA